jgi:hypothetical protein
MAVLEKLKALSQLTLPARPSASTPAPAPAAAPTPDSGLTPEQLLDALETAQRRGLL